MPERPFRDYELPDPDEEDDENENEYVPCPNCGADVYEDSECCPSCGDYIVHPTTALAGRPWWFIVFGVVGIVAVILCLL